MEKYISKGFDTLRELTSFLNEKGIKRTDIVYIGPLFGGDGYTLIYTK